MNARVAYSIACLTLFACGGSSSESADTTEGALERTRPAAPQLRSGEYGHELALLVADRNVTGFVRAYTGDVLWDGSKCEFTLNGTLSGAKVELEIVKLEIPKPVMRGRGLLEVVDAQTVKLTWKNGVSRDDPRDACLQVFGDSLDRGQSLTRTGEARETGVTYRTIATDNTEIQERGTALETKLLAGNTVAVHYVAGELARVKFTDWGYVNGQSKPFEGAVTEGFIVASALVPLETR